MEEPRAGCAVDTPGESTTRAHPKHRGDPNRLPSSGGLRTSPNTCLPKYKYKCENSQSFVRIRVTSHLIHPRRTTVPPGHVPRQRRSAPMLQASADTRQAGGARQDIPHLHERWRQAERGKHSRLLGSGCLAKLFPSCYKLSLQVFQKEGMLFSFLERTSDRVGGGNM